MLFTHFKTKKSKELRKSFVSRRLEGVAGLCADTAILKKWEKCIISEISPKYFQTCLHTVEVSSRYPS